MGDEDDDDYPQDALDFVGSRGNNRLLPHQNLQLHKFFLLSDVHVLPSVAELEEFIETNNADVDELDEGGFTAISFSLNQSTKEHALLMLKRSKNLNFRCPQGWTYLHQAVIRDLKEIIVYLLEHGADIEAQTHHGSNVLKLGLYCFSKPRPIITLLLRYGFPLLSKPHHLDINPKTSPERLFIYQYEKVICVLLARYKKTITFMGNDILRLLFELLLAEKIAIT